MYLLNKIKIKIKDKRYKYMNIKSSLIKKELESLRMVLHFLLNFRKPTDRLVVSCSQQLDEVIVKYHKIQAAIRKAA
jgi:hypothetical protein